MKVVEYLLGTLEKNRVEVIFGNPGTTEIPLVRACERQKKIRYVVALSEIAAVPMADGYARAKRRLGVVNLHVAPGLGNGMGTLYTAGIAGTPLLVLVGGQDRRFLHTQPILWGPVEQMARSRMQGGVRARLALRRRGEHAPRLARRADAALRARRAHLPARSPRARNTGRARRRARAGARRASTTRPRSAYAQFLSSAKRPAIVAAEDVHWSDAAKALEALAAAYAAPVYAAPYTGVLPISASSPWYAGYLPPSMKQIAERLEDRDALLFLGGRGLRTTLYSEAAFPGRKAWIGNDPAVQPRAGRIRARVHRRHRARAAGDRRAIQPKASRRARSVAMRHAARAAAGKEPACCIRRARSPRCSSAIATRSGSTSRACRPPTCASGCSSPRANTSSTAAAASAGDCRPRSAARSRGATRQIVAAIGDGSALYASEALWTGAHYGTKMLLVVFANRRYATLNEAAGRLAGGALESFTIEPPVLDFSGLAKLYGWNYASAATEEELDRAARATRQRWRAIRCSS